MKILVIYNPKAGSKKGPLHAPNRLQILQDLFLQYQIPADFSATKGPNDATLMAKQAIKRKYTHVIAAGGDGTISEVATGLINSNVIMGILPLGTFMNIARMLSVPMDLEQAVMLIKIGKTRKIDVGQVTKLSGDKLQQPVFFLENSGIGMEAELQRAVGLWEKGDWRQLLIFIRTIFAFYSQKFTIKIDRRIIKTTASLVEISNGPWTGAALNMAPDAKLNDHRLTVSIFHMQKWELLFFLGRLLGRNPARSRKIERHQGKTIVINSHTPRLVHADASEFGYTPVSYSLIPNALNIITGFIKPQEKTSLRSRSALDR